MLKLNYFLPINALYLTLRNYPKLCPHIHALNTPPNNRVSQNIKQFHDCHKLRIHTKCSNYTTCANSNPLAKPPSKHNTADDILYEIHNKKNTSHHCALFISYMCVMGLCELHLDNPISTPFITIKHHN